MIDGITAQLTQPVTPGLINPDECPHCGMATTHLSYLACLNHVSNCEGDFDMAPAVGGHRVGFKNFIKTVLNL